MSAESFRPIKFCKFEISASEKFVGAEKFFASESWRVDKVYGSEKFCQRESKCGRGNLFEKFRKFKILWTFLLIQFSIVDVPKKFPRATTRSFQSLEVCKEEICPV